MNGKKALLTCYFSALLLLTGAIGLLDVCAGWKLIQGGASYLLLGLLICSAIVALSAWISGKISVKWGKIAVGALGGLIAVVLAALMYLFFSMELFYRVPSLAAETASPDGAKAVILRTFSDDLEKMDVRAEARGAELKEDGGYLYEISDIGVTYRAYPKKLLLFYDAKHPSDGSLETGCQSQTVLKYEWNGRKLRVYLENPEPGDGGELTLDAP